MCAYPLIFFKSSILQINVESDRLEAVKKFKVR